MVRVKMKNMLPTNFSVILDSGERDSVFMALLFDGKIYFTVALLEGDKIKSLILEVF